MYIFLFSIFFSLPFLYSIDTNPVISVYGSFESLSGSRIPIQENKGNFLIQYNTNKKFQASIEKRGTRDLGSFEYKNKFFYFSAGHRYKPINGFYFLRDTYSYSAFQNPQHGVIQQPLNQSIFTGGILKDWGLGGFYGGNITKRKIGLYLNSPDDIIGIAYSPESKIGFFSLNLRNSLIISRELETTLSSQIYGSKQNFFGYFNSRFFSIRNKLEFYSSIMKDDKINSLQTNRDTFGSTPDRMGLHLKISYNFYNRIEHFSEFYRYGRESMTGGNAALFSLPIGSLCFGGRYYDKKEIQAENFYNVYKVFSGNAGWEWKRNSEEFILRIEQRENKDRVFELKTTLRPIHDWRLEISAITNGKTNQIRSVYEQWSDGENINTIYTDRETALKLKIIGSYVVVNISGSRTKEGSEIYYSNLQFKIDF